MKKSLIAIVLGLSVCAAIAGAQKKAATPAQEWQTYNHDLAGTRFSPLTEINTANVAQLQKAWSYSPPPPPGGGRGGGLGGGSEAVPIVVAGVMYLPVRRSLLDLGWIQAASFRAPDGADLVLWDDGRYRLGAKVGKYSIERFPEAPWISCIRLDGGERLYVKWQDRVYRVEDIPALSGSRGSYSRN